MTNPDAVRHMLRLLTWTAASTHANGEKAAVAATGHGLTRWQLLDLMSGPGTTVPAAARELRQSRQATQRLTDALEQAGLVERAPNPGHRTSPIFRTTARATETLKDLDNSVSGWIDHLCSRMTAEEVDHFIHLLGRVREIADEYRVD
ncbi:helix-turn-helix domain-containing protein [Pseudarthrobacter sp. SL88]|uniref:MarR family winged helix-turn-helix transcriptional regulator n=1 Tax=Pseudarthrobacter sp. SL88 TaxID=2994666 RepID=UPI002274DD7F|nr:helix-turn-helix domain-containing protein [Pseudarthrobacter sp. SL88]MCY1674951.1 helix-turn-helix domain-containing protein [Pseudarthrobacter sp. SL88]